jgi:hypothetical protein
MLANIRMDLGATSGEDAAGKFAHAVPVATVKLNGNTGEETLEVRRDGDQYYARSSVVEGISPIDSALGQTLGENLDDFRNKKLFDFGFDDPNKIELRDNTTTWLFTRAGTDWLSNGKKVDAGGVESLVAKLRDLTATKFVDTTFTHPEIEATVTSGDGKSIEKIQISKLDGNYLATRDNDSTVYQLDSDAVTDLISSAAAIKAISK